MLEQVFIHEIKKEVPPKFMKLPDEITYTRGDKLGTKRYWEMSRGMDTVHILINKTDSKEILLVKQVRPPVLVGHPETGGICIEACAGMVDKYPEMEDTPGCRAGLIAAEEVHEEMGYSIKSDKMQYLPTYFANVGLSSGMCYPFYCEVTDADFIGQALTPSEDIEVLAIPYEELQLFLQTCTTTDATTRQLIQWFIIEYGSTW